MGNAKFLFLTHSIMRLKDKLNQELKTAMKAKDQVSLRALRAMKSAILLAETAEGRPLTTNRTSTEQLRYLKGINESTNISNMGKSDKKTKAANIRLLILGC